MERTVDKYPSQRGCNRYDWNVGDHYVLGIALNAINRGHDLSRANCESLNLILRRYTKYVSAADDLEEDRAKGHGNKSAVRIQSCNAQIGGLAHTNYLIGVHDHLRDSAGGGEVADSTAVGLQVDDGIDVANDVTRASPGLAAALVAVGCAVQPDVVR